MIELGAITEVALLLFGAYLTWRNKSNRDVIKELEERNRRLRIELVLMEDKLEDSEERVSSLEKALDRTHRTQERIQQERFASSKYSKREKKVEN